SPEPVERGQRRIPAVIPVDCLIDEVDEPAGERLVGRTQDVGGGGVFIRSSAAPSVGTRVRVTLGPTPDSGDRFEFEGRVAWIGADAQPDRGFGVRFDRGSRDGRRLRTLLRRAYERGRVSFGR